MVTSYVNSRLRCVLFSQLHIYSRLKQTPPLQRIEGQPPLPVRDLEAEAATRNQHKDKNNEAKNEEESLAEDEESEEEA